MPEVLPGRILTKVPGALRSPVGRNLTVPVAPLIEKPELDNAFCSCSRLLPDLNPAIAAVVAS